jgi:hypothetical protein
MYLESVRDAVLERSSRELVAAFFIAATAAMFTSGLFILFRRRMGDVIGLVAGLTMASVVAGMALTAGDLRLQATMAGANDFPARLSDSAPGSRASRFHGPRRGTGFRPMPSPGALFVFAADGAADGERDGRLSPDEVAQFIRGADPSERGSVDAREIDTFLRQHFPPPRVQRQGQHGADHARGPKSNAPPPPPSARDRSPLSEADRASLARGARSSVHAGPCP